MPQCPPCAPGQVCNPATGNCVLETGRIGRRLLAARRDSATPRRDAPAPVVDLVTPARSRPQSTPVIDLTSASPMSINVVPKAAAPLRKIVKVKRAAKNGAGPSRPPTSPAARAVDANSPWTTVSPAYAAVASPAYAAAVSPAYTVASPAKAAKAAKAASPPKPRHPPLAPIAPVQYATVADPEFMTAHFRVPPGMSIVYLVHPGTQTWSLPRDLRAISAGGVRGSDLVSIGGQLYDAYRHGEKVPDVRVGAAAVAFPLPDGPPARSSQAVRLSDMVKALAWRSSKGVTVVVGPAAGA